MGRQPSDNLNKVCKFVFANGTASIIGKVTKELKDRIHIELENEKEVIINMDHVALYGEAVEQNNSDDMIADVMKKKEEIEIIDDDSSKEEVEDIVEKQSNTGLSDFYVVRCSNKAYKCSGVRLIKKGLPNQEDFNLISEQCSLSNPNCKWGTMGDLTSLDPAMQEMLLDKIIIGTFPKSLTQEEN